MNDNLFEAKYDITEKSKLRKFYDSNKILIFSSILIPVILIALFIFYIENKEKNQLILSENYIQAKIYIEYDEKKKATEILKKIILKNDSTYSTLSLFLIVDQNLIKDKKEIVNLFDHVLSNNKLKIEIENLIIFKKSLFYSNFASESELLTSLKTLLNSDNLWKPHALLLVGNYFFDKKEFVKAKEFYVQILSLSNLNKELYDQARSQLMLTSND